MTTLISFNNEMVLLGRQLRRVTQGELASAINITQGHLSKIEHGLTEPSEAVIEQISKELNLPRGFFFRKGRIYGLPISIQYRKKATAGQHSLDYINALFNTHVLNLTALLTSVELKNEFEIPKLDIYEYKGNIEKIADSVRRNWLLPKGPIKNLTESLEQAGCIVIWCDLSNIPVYGLSFVPGKHPCIFLNKNQPADKMRFTLAHELGHLVMHSVPNSEMEKEADQFASAFLMPFDDIRKDLIGRVSLPRIASLKPLWRVSMQSLLVRAKAIGVISETQSRYLWQQISSLGLRMHEPPELDFDYEAPTLLESIFKIHMDNLGYSIDEIADMIKLHKSDLLNMYPFLEKKKGHLRLINNN
jgi:Zn-dependent peptidase ImmA (M78 family)/DNA-binding XRE family transcriptional regulator